MRKLYSFSVFLYTLGIRIAAFWNPKARLWVSGRKDIFPLLESAFMNQERKTVWMHCASLGEFEQGRPLLEAIRKEYPNYTILLTFFSPSGFQIRNKYSGADFVFYLPSDSPENAKKFIKITRPILAVFIKYEFWYNYLATLKSNQVPILLVSALFRKGQPFFKSYGSFWRKKLWFYEKIFVQDNASYKLLESAGFGQKSIVSGIPKPSANIRYRRIFI